MKSNGLRGVAVAALLVVAVSLLVWAGVHNGRERRLEMQKTQETQASKAMLMPEANAAANPADSPMSKLNGKSAPAFTLVNLDGKKVSLADFKGKPVLVNFWATWCGPCKLEMPWFEEFNKKYSAQGLVILGVAADEAGKNVIAGTAKKSGVTYPILLGDDKMEEAYGGIDYLPETFYVDRSGKVLLGTAGVSSEDGGKDEIEANIKKLLAVGGA